MKQNRFFKKIKPVFSKSYIKYSLVLIAGLFLGWLIFHGKGGTSAENSTALHENNDEKKTIWTCSMHPQIRMDKPGKCPICGMDLIPLNQGSEEVDQDAIHLNKEAAELANVLTSIVSKQKPIKEIRLYGKVQADERLLQSQVAHIPGRIEKLLVNFTGEQVIEGQKLAEIY